MMLRLAVRRLLAIIPLLLILSIATFAVSTIMPGDPSQAAAGDQATPEQLQQIRDEMHLTDPAPVRYIHWLGGVLHGDLGVSFGSHRSVAAEIGRRFPVTATLALISLLLALLVGVPVGIAQGIKPGSRLDRGLLIAVSLALSTPGFWLATLLVLVFAVELQWLPAVGYVAFTESPVGWLQHIILPAVTLAVAAGAEMARQLRTGMVDVVQADFVRAARARGLSARRVMGKHALKNAAMPAVTIVGLRVGYLFAGAVIIEQIFQLPGLGNYALQAIQQRDYPALQGVVLAVATIIIVINLIVDLTYAWLNPKVRMA
ncbi:MAG TPA: ABC transporter permease [Candidatus Dormibacteraeota bacterium]|jgi:peptide/nickel transport system permease protein|nr:ABC transporter permease [Candidatus Dormibacteraeota bacterium]